MYKDSPSLFLPIAFCLLTPSTVCSLPHASGSVLLASDSWLLTSLLMPPTSNRAAAASNERKRYASPLTWCRGLG